MPKMVQMSLFTLRLAVKEIRSFMRIKDEHYEHFASRSQGNQERS